MRRLRTGASLAPPALPRAWSWDHNAHYHRWLLRQVPDRFARALDVGCGTGELLRRLTDRADRVDGVDVSADMIRRARAGVPAGAGVRCLVGDVLDPGVALEPAGYDVVTAVASLHHMPLRPALSRLAELVAPGGTLVVIGLHQPASAIDRAVDVLALPANAAVGAFLAARGRAGKPHDEGMPVQQPTATLADLRAAAAELVPGARLRRHLFWRCSLTWTRPAVP